MKQYILISLLCSVIFSGATHSNINPLFNPSTIKTPQISDSIRSDILLGEWNVYKTIRTYPTLNDTTEFLCFACPQIIFNSDNTATVKSSSKNIDTIQWKIRDKVLSINNQSSRFFKNSEYSIKYISNKEYEELQLTSSIFENINETIVLRK